MSKLKDNIIDGKWTGSHTRYTKELEKQVLKQFPKPKSNDRKNNNSSEKAIHG